MSKFNRSAYMKERHKEAREQQKFYNEKYSNEKKKPKYFEFLKEDSPLQNKIIAYDVSYQLSYRGSQDAILITPKTFTVYGFMGSEEQIQQKTMNMVVDSKGAKTNNRLNTGMMGAIEDNIEVKVFPRGMETSQRQIDRDKTEKVIEKGLHVETLDETITMKNKKGREGTLNLDVRHFL